MSRGIFVSFEGSEGCGKSTQIERLASRLRELGHSPLLTREPGGTPIGEKIRDLLQYDKSAHAMTAEAELLLFAASRAQLCREVIKPALDSGRMIIADRFLDSTTVYQGVARRISPEIVDRVNQFAVGGIVPDITFVLDLEPKVAQSRLKKRSGADAREDRMEQQAPEFYDAVRHGYLALARSEPGRVKLIDAAPAAESVAAEIWRHLYPLLSL